MKAKFLLSSLSLMLVTGFVFGMDEKPKKLVASKAVAKPMDHHLLFILNDEKEIVEYGSRNMEFACPPTEFMGKKITKAVPLSGPDQKVVRTGLKNAKESNKRAEVNYTLQDQAFVAAIRYHQDKQQYNVKVRNADVKS
jgi:hypothetical protein